MGARLPRLVAGLAVLALLALLGLALVPEPEAQPPVPQLEARRTALALPTSTASRQTLPPAATPSPSRGPSPTPLPGDLPLLLLEAGRLGSGLPLRTLLAPDGNRVAVIRAGQMIVYDLRNMPMAWSIDTSDQPRSIAFSPDGQRLAVGFESGRVELRTADGELRLEGPPHSAPVTHLALAPDYTLASSTDQGEAMIWHSQSATMLSNPGDIGTVQQLIFSPAGYALLMVGDGGALRVWAAADGEELATLELEPGPLSARFSLDGNYLYTVSLPPRPDSNDKPVRLRRWSTRAWKLLSERELTVPDMQAALPSSLPGTVLTISPAGIHESVLSDAGLTVVQSWPLTLPLGEPATLRPPGVVAASTRNMFAWVTMERQLVIWDFAHIGGQGLPPLQESADPRMRLQLSADDSTLLAQEADGTLRLWRTADGSYLGSLRPRTAPIATFAISPGGSLLAAGGEAGRIYLWDLLKLREGGEPELSQLIVREGAGDVGELAFSSDGKLLAGASGNSIFIWHLSERRWLHDPGFVAEPSAGQVRDLHFRPGDESLRYLLGEELRTVPLVDQGLHMMMRLMAEPVRDVPALVSPDGRQMALMINDGSVRVTLVEEQVTARIIDIPHGWAGPFAFGKNWETLATLDQKVLRLWQARDVTLSWTVDLGARGTSIVASPDGGSFVLGLEDGVIQVRESASGALRAIVHAHDGPVTRLAFAPDGTLVSSDGEGTLRLWTITGGY